MYKHNSSVWNSMLRLQVWNSEKFILLVTISLQSCQRSNSSSNSVDSSYFCRIAYRDLFSQMHALCRRHTFNHCNEPPWLNSKSQIHLWILALPGEIRRLEFQDHDRTLTDPTAEIHTCEVMKDSFLS